MAISNVGASPVSAFASEIVTDVAPDADLWEIAAALVDGDVGALAVRNGDDVHGIVSERDVVQALASRREPADTSALDLAHTRLVWCDANSTVAEVAEEMMEHYIRHVLVENDGEVVGIVSMRDLLGAYAAAEFDE